MSSLSLEAYSATVAMLLLLGIQAQARKLARLEAQLKESEERQLQAIKTAQTEAQTNVLEMTEQLEKLEAFVVSTSKMVSEAIKPKDTSWWSN